VRDRLDRHYQTVLARSWRAIDRARQLGGLASENYLEVQGHARTAQHALIESPPVRPGRVRLSPATSLQLLDDALEALTIVHGALQADPMTEAAGELEVLERVAFEVCALRTLLGGPIAVLCTACGAGYELRGLPRCPACD
jgi:hypothetical protein